MTYQEWFDGLPPWVQKDIGQSMTVDEFKAKMFHVDEAKFTNWYSKTLEKHEKDKKCFEVNRPEDNFAIPNLPPNVQSALNTVAEDLILSAQTLVEHLKHNVTSEKYVSVINKIKYCNKILQSKDGRIALIIHEKPDEPYVALLKATQDYLEAYLVGLHRLNDRTLSQFLKLPLI